MCDVNRNATATLHPFTMWKVVRVRSAPSGVRKFESEYDPVARANWRHSMNVDGIFSNGPLYDYKIGEPSTSITGPGIMGWVRKEDALLYVMRLGRGRDTVLEMEVPVGAMVREGELSLLPFDGPGRVVAVSECTPIREVTE